MSGPVILKGIDDTTNEWRTGGPQKSEIPSYEGHGRFPTSVQFRRNFPTKTSPENPNAIRNRPPLSLNTGPISIGGAQSPQYGQFYETYPHSAYTYNTFPSISPRIPGNTERRNSTWSTPRRAYIPPAIPSGADRRCNVLYVSNLPLETSEDELKNLFTRQRGYRRLDFRNRKNGPLCFVEFDDVSCAAKALRTLYGWPLASSKTGGIRLSFSKGPIETRPPQSPGPPPPQHGLSQPVTPSNKASTHPNNDFLPTWRGPEATAQVEADHRLESHSDENPSFLPTFKPLEIISNTGKPSTEPHFKNESSEGSSFLPTFKPTNIDRSDTRKTSAEPHHEITPSENMSFLPTFKPLEGKSDTGKSSIEPHLQNGSSENPSFLPTFELSKGDSGTGKSSAEPRLEIYSSKPSSFLPTFKLLEDRSDMGGLSAETEQDVDTDHSDDSRFQGFEFNDLKMRLIRGPRYRVDTFDQYRIWLEQTCGQKLDWYPLPSIRHPLMSSESRLVWIYNGQIMSIALNDDETQRCARYLDEIPGRPRQPPEVLPSLQSEMPANLSSSEIIRLVAEVLVGSLPWSWLSPGTGSSGTSHINRRGSDTTQRMESNLSVDEHFPSTREASDLTVESVERMENDLEFFVRVRHILGEAEENLLQQILSMRSYTEVSLSRFYSQPDNSDKVKTTTDFTIQMRVYDKILLEGIRRPEIGCNSRTLLDSMPKLKVAAGLEKETIDSGWGFHVKQSLSVPKVLGRASVALMLGLGWVPFLAPLAFLVTMIMLWVKIVAVDISPKEYTCKITESGDELLISFRTSKIPAEVVSYLASVNFFQQDPQP